MKKKWKVLLITVSYLILILVILLLANKAINDNKKVDRIVRIDATQIINITLVNNLTGQAKKIIRPKDIDSICHFFNTEKMHRLKNWDGTLENDSGYSLSFIFHAVNLKTIQINCYDGSCLVNNGEAYSINNKKIEEFWDLKYKESKYTYAGIY